MNTETKNFPNGFASWQETHYEIVTAIALELDKAKPSGVAAETRESQGTNGLFTLAEELTDKFELLHKGREWDGEFFEAITDFINENLYSEPSKDFYLLSDQPTTCPKCGSRTEFQNVLDVQVHKCFNSSCGYEFLTEQE